MRKGLLKEKMKKEGLTLKRVEALSGVSEKSLQRYLNGYQLSERVYLRLSNWFYGKNKLDPHTETEAGDF